MTDLNLEQEMSFIRGRARRKMDRYLRMYPCQNYWDFLDVLLRHLERRIIEWKAERRAFHDAPDESDRLTEGVSSAPE